MLQVAPCMCICLSVLKHPHSVCGADRAGYMSVKTSLALASPESHKLYFSANTLWGSAVHGRFGALLLPGCRRLAS